MVKRTEPQLRIPWARARAFLRLAWMTFAAVIVAGCEPKSPAPPTRQAWTAIDTASLYAQPPESLDSLLARAAALDTSRDVLALIEFDLRIERSVDAFNARVNERWKRIADGEPGSDSLRNMPVLSGAYDPIGVRVEVFNRDTYVSSRKYLARAHALNPRSPWRAYTLVMQPRDSARYPDDLLATESQRAYLREFPDGPHAAGAAAALAEFFDDLYKILKGRLAGEHQDYKDDCFDRYVTKAPLADQLRAANDSAVHYYRLVVQLRPMDLAARRNVTTMIAGVRDTWWYCPD